jgi:hypothetical protein
MTTEHNNIPNTSFSPQGKGSIQFSTSTKARQSTPNSAFNLNNNEYFILLFS